MSHSRPIFLHFRLFNTVDSKQMFYIKVCQWTTDFENDALPNEPQPLPYLLHCLEQYFNKKYISIYILSSLFCFNSSLFFVRKIWVKAGLFYRFHNAVPNEALGTFDSKDNYIVLWIRTQGDDESTKLTKCVVPQTILVLFANHRIQ